MESAAIDESVIEKARANDLAAIVAKVAAGRVLTARERSLLENTQKPADAQFALVTEAAPGPLAFKTISELAEIWGYSPRQIKNWICDGKAANDPAPVREPEKMAAWFARVYAPREAPERLVLAAQRILAGVRFEAPAVVPTVEPIDVPEDAKGMAAMLERLRTSEARLHAEYERLVLQGEQVRAQFIFSEWVKLSERLRAAEKAAPRTLEELGVFVRKADVARELVELHGAVLKTIRGAFRAGRARLLEAHDVRAWNAAVDRIIEDAGARLVDSSFAEPLELTGE